MDIQQIIVDNLTKKYEELKNRMIKAIHQLTEDQINWRPNLESNSIANIIIHIHGNYKQRIVHGLYGFPDVRDRDGEFSNEIHVKTGEIMAIIEEVFNGLIEKLHDQRPEDLIKPRLIRGNEATVFEVFFQCANHYSEHLGQVLYITKLLLDNKYQTTTIPRQR